MTNGGNLKPGWKSWRFDQIAINVNERIDDPSKAGVEHYVGLEHLDPDSLKIRRWGRPDDVEATKLCFKKGDIIFGRRRAYQRKLGVAEFDGICSAHAMVLRPRTDVVLPEFLPFFMQSDLFMNRAVEISVGSLSPTINWKTLAVQQFGLPPLEEQLRLVELFLALEAGVEAYECLNKSTTIMLTSFVDSFFSVSKSDFPRVRVESVANLVTKGESPHWQGFGYLDEGIPFVTSENVLDGRLSLGPQKFISDDFHKKLSRSVIRPNDVLINIVGASIGRACVVPSELTEANTNQAVAILRFKERTVHPQFFLSYFKWPKFQQSFLGNQVNTARANISLKNIRDLEIPTPTWEIQMDFVEKCNGLIQANLEEILRLNSLKSIKKTLINGSSQ